MKGAQCVYEARAIFAMPRSFRPRLRFRATGRTWPKVGRIRPKVGQMQPEVGRSQTKFDRVRPTFGRIRTNAVVVVGRTRPKSGQIRPKFVQMRPKFGRLPELGRNQPNFAIGSNLAEFEFGQFLSKSVQNWLSSANSGRIRPALVAFGPNLADVGAYLADFVAILAMP